MYGEKLDFSYSFLLMILVSFYLEWCQSRAEILSFNLIRIMSKSNHVNRASLPRPTLIVIEKQEFIFIRGIIRFWSLFLDHWSCQKKLRNRPQWPYL